MSAIADALTRVAPRRAARAARQLAWVAAAKARNDTIVGRPDESPALVEQELTSAGIAFERWRVPADGYRTYMDAADYPESYLGGRAGGDRFFGEKSLEHYVSLALANPRSTSVLIDVASNSSPFISIARRTTGCTCYEQDLQFEPGVVDYRIGGNAAEMPVPDNFADVMTLHCSFDHFEGDADTGFAVEAGRVLKPGGVVVVLPLYMSNRFGAKVNPRRRQNGLVLDAGSTRWLMPHLEERFSRVYNAATLKQRVLDPAARAGLHWSVVRIEGSRDVVPSAYLNFALLLRKPS